MGKTVKSEAEPVKSDFLENASERFEVGIYKTQGKWIVYSKNGKEVTLYPGKHDRAGAIQRAKIVFVRVFGG